MASGPGRRPPSRRHLGGDPAAGPGRLRLDLGGPDLAWVRLLRAAHTGSVSDYAAYAVAGMLAVIAMLTLT